MTQPTVSPETAPPVPVVPDGRRGYLDGIRALAVYLVVAFHAGIARFSGGHIGVDVFFVLSGYLVTGVLLRDLARSPSGTKIRYGRFYARRARRLLPAAILALVGTAVGYATFASTAELVDAVDGFKAAAVYLTNWHLISNSTGYFATDTTESPILHFWSLAVEEQFYLVWPLLFTGIVAVARLAGRHRWNVARILVASLAAGSAIELFLIRATRPDHAYYGTDVRAYQLLAGALLALTPQIVARARRLGSLNDVAALGAVIGLVSLTITGGRTGPVARGYVTTVLTVVVIVALESGMAARIARFFGSRSIAYLGAISYGTYLWHWPVVVLAGLVGEFSPMQLAVLSALLGTGLAALSYELVEQPIRSARRLDRFAWPVAGAGLAMSVFVGFVVLPQVLTGNDRQVGSSTVAAAEVSGFTPVPASFSYQEVNDAGFGNIPSCDRLEPDRCVLVEGSGPHVAIYGDSNSLMWVPAFEVIAEEHDLTLSVLSRPGCRWQDGLMNPAQVGTEQLATCEANQRFAYDRAIPELAPDLLVVTNSVELEPASTNQPPGPLASTIENTTKASLESLAVDDRRVLVIESKPMPAAGPEDPLACLADATYVEECRFTTMSGPTWIERLERDEAQRLPGVSTADFDQLICPFGPICDPIIDGVPVYWDGKHITVEFSRMIAPQVETYLEEQGFLE